MSLSSDSEHKAAEQKPSEASDDASSSSSESSSDEYASPKLRPESDSQAPSTFHLRDKFLPDPDKPSSLPSLESALANAQVHFTASESLPKPPKAPTMISAPPTVAPPRNYTLPEAGNYHVALTFVEAMKVRAKAAEEQSRHMSKKNQKKQLEEEYMKKRGLSVKEKEKIKRQKGQSSREQWHSETWMKLRQQFD